MPNYKYCNKCKSEKPVDNFYKKSQNKDGHSSNCKDCDNAFRKQWAENNPEKDRQYKQKWDDNNKQRKVEYKRQWRSRNRDKDIEYARRWQSKNPGHAAKYMRERRKNDKDFRLKEAIKGQLKRVLDRTGQNKESRTFDIVGYSSEKLEKRLEYQFVDGMTWENYGDVWEVDHIISIDYFIKKGEKRHHIINALSNLRPLWVTENRNKSGKFYKDFYSV